MQPRTREIVRRKLVDAAEALREAREALGPLYLEETVDIHRQVFVAQLAVRDADAVLSLTDTEISRPPQPPKAP